MNPALVIDNVVIPPGANKIIEMEIARLSSGTLIHMPVHVFRASKPGPVLLLSGGLHGDEINGVEIVRRIIAGNMLKKLRAGTVVALPIINVYGFIHFSREVPDGKDVNRSFPGSPDGSLASIVAHQLTTKILPVIDCGIDFHTGGASRTNYPQIRYASNTPGAAGLAQAFSAPYSLQSNLIQHSLRAQADQMGKALIVYEGGESLRFNQKSIRQAVRGVKRVLYHFGMSDKAEKPKQNYHLAESQWVRSDASGIFQLRKRSGQSVVEGELLGRINNPYNQFSVKITSPVTGHIIGHNNMPLVHKGDALFHVATEG